MGYSAMLIGFTQQRKKDDQTRQMLLEAEKIVLYGSG